MMLTGGVVFSILTKYKARSVSSKERTTGARSGNSEPEMMAALVEAVAPGTETNLNSLKSNTSEYKNCECNGTKNIPFDDPDVISDYRYQVENEYSPAVKQMKAFTDNFIKADGKRCKLVSDLITAVQLDKTIGEESFYVLPSGDAIKKQDLVKIKELPLETLLVGLMYFVLTERAGRNDMGKDMLKFMKTGDYNHLRVKCVPWVEETGAIKEDQSVPSEARKSGKLPSGKKVFDNLAPAMETFADVVDKTAVDKESILRTGKVIADTLEGVFEKDHESEKCEEKAAESEVVEVVEPRRDDRGNTFINNGNGPQIGTVNGDFNYYYPGGEKDGK